MNLIVVGSIASLIAGLATGIGALPVLFVKTLTDRLQGIFLGFGGGVMLAATAFSLIVPGADLAMGQGNTETQAALIMVLGILLGGGFLWLAHNNFPHEHFFKGQEGPSTPNLARIWLFVVAITLHNFPEGMAVGVGFSGGSLSSGIALAIGIGLQNMPEGLVVAVALRSLNYSSLYALGVACLTGLVEPIGGVVGASIISLAQPLLPWAMAFAAGAMLFVISDEIIPETSRKGIQQEGTLGIMLGFVVMMYLDVALG
ncbi:ZIP family metal transporter [Acaryochloris sp. CCMEE 5410]|uniref:ZIP family metal transporter n=1 Tax=Acaryochloris sp. CCMEE 5410 TaxID=310037 RepID=UPI0002483D61|nr:ZIP family metal transporter [Acaryochloris sp. CCMEE 5410]KAI9131228.1 ZIP family metal transporter [Acaryochloris sp. CCMEE 5410]